MGLVEDVEDVVGVGARDSKAIKIKQLPFYFVITEASLCNKILKAIVIANRLIHLQLQVYYFS